MQRCKFARPNFREEMPHELGDIHRLQQP